MFKLANEVRPCSWLPSSHFACVTFIFSEKDSLYTALKSCSVHDSANLLWLLRNGTITEYKADKILIGKYLETDLSFSNTWIQLQKDDLIYLSTDGDPASLGATTVKVEIQALPRFFAKC